MSKKWGGSTPLAALAAAILCWHSLDFGWPKYRISPSISPWSSLRRQLNSKMKVNVCQRCLIASVHRYLSFFVHMARIRVKGNCSKCHGFSWLRGWKGGWSLPNFARGQRYNLDKGLEMWSYNQENSLGACSPCAGRKCGYSMSVVLKPKLLVLNTQYTAMI